MLVTGGAGFIGSNFIQKWFTKSQGHVQSQNEIQAGGALVCFDKLTYAGNLENLKSIAKKPDFHFVQGDICDSVVLNSVFEKYRPHAVLHFAAESHVDRSIHGPASFIETNIRGTFNLLEASKTFWQGLSPERQKAFRFLHVSTDEVYGSLAAADPAFNEMTRYSPNSPYAASKASSDHLVRAYFHTYGLPTITTNCSNNYGPNQFPEKLIPLVIHNALKNEKIPIYGDGSNRRDWLFVQDHCDAIQIALSRGSVGETYNIGGSSEKTNIEVVDFICRVLDGVKPRSDHKSYLLQKTFVKDRPGHDQRYAVDTAKIERDFGWRPKETFESGLRKTIMWYLENQDWVNSVTSGDYRKWVLTQYQVDQI